MSDSYNTVPTGYTYRDMTDVTEIRSVNNNNRFMNYIRKLDTLNVIGIVAALIITAYVGLGIYYGVKKIT